jgi:IS1 family transposase
MRLGARVGMGAIKLHDRTVHSLQVPRIKMDEAWSYVVKKRRNVKKEDGPEIGDQWVFVAMSASSKVIINYMVGKRDKATANSFVMGIRERVINAPEISSDALHAYNDAVDHAFRRNATTAKSRRYIGPNRPRTRPAATLPAM